MRRFMTSEIRFIRDNPQMSLKLIAEKMGSDAASVYGVYKRAKRAAGLTQQQAGELLSVGVRTWQRWEHGERKMSTAMWELFRIKTGERK